MGYESIPQKVTELFWKLAADRRIYTPEPMTVLESEVGPVMVVKMAVYNPNAVPPGTPKLPWRVFGAASRLLGGTNAITSALLGGALSAALGYGAGYVGSRFLPRDKFPKRERLPKTLAILGGLTGGLGFGLVHGLPLVAQEGWRGLLSPGPFGKKAAQHLPAALAYAKLWSEDDAAFVKEGQIDAGMALPSIPVDQFNRMIIEDPLTPWPARAGAAGIVQGASLAKGGSPFVTPMDIGRVAMGMGSGYLSGMLVGKALGALAGLAPDTQQKLKQTGAWAGFIKNVAPLAFGR